MRRTVILIFCMFSSLVASAQDDQFNRFSISLYGDVGIPSHQLRKATDNWIGGIGIGLGLNVLYDLEKELKQPLAVGFDFSYLNFWKDKIMGTDHAILYKNSHNYYGIGGLLRLTPVKHDRGFTPFVDGMIGRRVFNTLTTVDKGLIGLALGDIKPEIVHSKDYSGLVYGLGVGWYIRNLKPHALRGTAFTMRAMYLFGADTGYIRRGSIKVNSEHVEYETGITGTNIMVVRLGVLLYN